MSQPPIAPPAARQPLLYAALVFALGIFAGAYLWRPPLWLFVSIANMLASASLLTRRRPRYAAALALAALAILGTLNFQLRKSGTDSQSLLPFADGREVIVTAHVIRENNFPAHAGAERRQTLDVETEQLQAQTAENAGSAVPLRAGVRLNAYSAQPSDDENDAANQPLPRFHYGERLRFPAKLRLPHNFGNAGAFDYRGYLDEQGIVALASVKMDRIELLPGFTGTRLKLWRNRLRGSLAARMRGLWSLENTAMLEAMLLGDRTQVERETRTNFQRSGAYHLLVVAGLHVGIIAFFVFWIVRRLLRRGEVLSTLATIFCAAGFAFLTGASIPTVRATAMLAIYLTTRMLYRDRSPLNAIGAAGLGMLLADPAALFDASFQLSFIAVLAIAGIALPLLQRTSQPYRNGLRFLDSLAYDISLPPRITQLRLDLRLISGRLARFLGASQRAEIIARSLMVGSGRALLAAYDVLVISAVIQVALALPMAAYFHRATVLALPANAIVVPLTGLLLPLAVVGVAASYVSTALALVPAALAAAALKIVTGTVHLLGGAGLSDVRVASPSLGIALAAAAAFSLAIVLARRKSVFAFAGLAALTLAAISIAVLPPKPDLRAGVLEITAIDVGQGDAILVVSPQGRTLLIDAGGSSGPWRSEFDFGEEVVSPYLWSRGIVRLDAIALTHGHADHIGGLSAVIGNFRPRELWVGANPGTFAYLALLRAASDYGLSVIRRHQGEQFDFGGAHVRVLAPPLGWELASQARNNDSLVLHFALGKTSALLEGDAEKKIERLISGEDPQADLLKVGHHGSDSSTTPELLSAAHPDFAIISVGGRNPFGHPRMEVLNRLARAHVSTFRTDTIGAVTFYLDGNSVAAAPAH